MSGRRGVDLRVIALPWRARVLWITLACLAAVLAALTFGIVAGSSRMGVADVWTTLLGAGSRTYQFIVFELRLPRVAAGIGVGLCLGLAGALTQTFSRNPLATPDILGVTSGASAGAVTATGWLATRRARTGCGVQGTTTTGTGEWRTIFAALEPRNT